MLRYLARRLLLTIPVLLGVATLGVFPLLSMLLAPLRRRGEAGEG